MSSYEQWMSGLPSETQAVVRPGLTPFASDPDALEIVTELVGKLNPEQLQVAVHPIDGPPILVLGGAGSGKTATLTRRLVYLILAGIDPSSVFAVTFTRKAAREMAARTHRLMWSLQRVARPPYDAWLNTMSERIGEAWITTFHSAGLRILRDTPLDATTNMQRLGYGAWSRVIDESERNGILEELIAGVHGDQRPEEIAGKISNAKGAFIYPEGFHHTVRTREDEVAAMVYPKYQEFLEHRGLMDFDDLIFRLYELFERFPEILDHYQQRFQSLLIDEYQDTNLSQYLVGMLLAKKHRRIMAVGDDDQSIYGWRGADVTNITRFIADYPDISIVKLVRNYRSDGAILAAANHIWCDKPAHLRKELVRARPENDLAEKIRVATCENEIAEARFIAEQSARALASGREAGEIAVLVRSHHLLAAIGAALSDFNLPWAQSGILKGLARPEVVGAMGFLETIALAVRRLVAAATWHVGDAESLAHALKLTLSGPGFNVAAYALKDLAQVTDYADLLLNEACRKEHRRVFSRDLSYAIDRIATAIQEALTKPELWSPSALLARVLELAPPPCAGDSSDAGWQAILRLQELALVADAQRFQDPVERLLAFSEDVQARAGLSGDQGESGPSPESGTASEPGSATEGGEPSSHQPSAIQLMTLHAAKGLEFEVVFLPAMEDGVLPSRPRESLPISVRVAQADEEKRLFYVGVSRAKQLLFLSHCRKRRTPYGEHNAQASPFLALIPKELIEFVSIS